MIYAVVGLLSIILTALMWIIIGQVILSWLVAFNVLNTSSAGLRAFLKGLDRFLEPLYRPIRKILPDFGGIDFSPLVILLIIAFIRGKLLPGILMEVGPTLS